MQKSSGALHWGVVHIEEISVKLTRQENADHFGVSIGETVSVGFEEYVAAVTASELASGGLEGCKAQAVAARTFAVSRGVLNGKAISDSSSVAQAYRATRYNARLYPVPLQAAQETAGEILTYNGKPISAVYSSSNGGRTVSSQERWGSIRPYLIAQEDPWDAAAGHKKNGHGVGMSQCGARYAAGLGISYRDILAFYYPGTQLTTGYGKAVNAVRFHSEKADKVVALAKERIGDPYVFGAWGEACTPANRRKRIRADQPNTVNRCQVLKGSRSTCDGCKYKGRACYDCRGFTYAMLKEAIGIVISGQGATTQYNSSANWEKRGTTSGGMPNCVCCIFKQVNGKTMSHTGLHAGDSKTIHCSGEVKEGIVDKTWTHWAIPKGMYTQEELNRMELITVTSILKRGSKGDNVIALQNNLNQLGYSCGEADGKFGAMTESAVRKFQADHHLTVDGIAGSATQNEILKALHGPDTEDPTPVGPASELDILKARIGDIENSIAELIERITALEKRLGEE